DLIRAHHAALDRGQMHGAALTAHEAVVALHELAQNLRHGHPAGKRMRVAPIGAEGKVAWLHGAGKSRRDRFLAEREMARAFDKVLQKKIIGALLALADHDLRAVQGEAELLA